MKIHSLVSTLILMSSLLPHAARAGMTEAIYGKMPDGREVKLWTLTNVAGMEAKVTEYGAILTLQHCE